MRRLFYLAVGAGAGVAAMRRAGRVVRALTPSGIAGSAGNAFTGLSGSVREFVDEVRVGMAEREHELNEALTGESKSTTFSSKAARAPGQNGRSAR